MPSLLAETGRLSNIRLTLLRRGHIYGGGRLSFRAPILSSSIMEPTDQSQDGKKYTLPSDFLSRPAPNLTVQKIDFSKTSLPQYGALYATVIDNALSEEECKALVRAAEAHADGKWEQAMVNVGLGRQKLISDVRDCGRIIWDDATVVDKIWSRISSSVPELKLIENAARVTGYGPVKRGETYQMTRLNERMRFLKYGSGQYFRPHQDGSYITPDGLERSFYTLHLYLNEFNPATNPLQGGATTFHSYDMNRTLDVAPKVGRVLLFQHRDLVHSGDDVLAGVKLTLRTDLMFRKV